MDVNYVLHQKRLVYIGLGTLLALLVYFFGQSINQIIWLGVSEGLQQLSTVLTLDTLPSLGNVVLSTMISAMSWRVGLTLALYIAFLAGGITLFIYYRRTLRSEAQAWHWFDYVFILAVLIVSALPLAIFLLSFLLFGLYAFNTLQAFNHLSATAIEPIITSWNSLLAILDGFTLNAENIKALLELAPQLTNAFANVGDVVTIWNQSTLFWQQLQTMATTLEFTKFIGLAVVIIADGGYIYAVVQASKQSENV